MYQTYEFGREYRDAHLSKIIQPPEIIDTLLSWTKDPKYFLFFHGNVGTGKTYFSAAWYNSLKEKKSNVRVYSEQHFFNDLKHIIQMNWNATDRVRVICEVDYLILDDFGSSKMMSEWQKDMLAEFIDLRYQSTLPTLITSNMNKNDVFHSLGHRSHSRLFAARNKIIEQLGEDRRQILDL